MLKRAAEVYDPKGTEEAAAWNEHHQMMRRARVNPTVHSDEYLAWKEHHDMLKRARVPIEHPVKDVKAAEHHMSYIRTPQVHIVPKKDAFVMVADCPGVRKVRPSTHRIVIRLLVSPPPAAYAQQEDLKVEIVETAGGGKAVMLSGERKSEDEEDKTDQSTGLHTYSHSYFYGRFSRVLPLPPYVDARAESLKAKYSNGSVRITLPKIKQEPAKPVKSTNIPIA